MSDGLEHNFGVEMLNEILMQRRLDVLQPSHKCLVLGLIAVPGHDHSSA